MVSGSSTEEADDTVAITDKVAAATKANLILLYYYKEISFNYLLIYIFTSLVSKED